MTFTAEFLKTIRLQLINKILSGIITLHNILRLQKVTLVPEPRLPSINLQKYNQRSSHHCLYCHPSHPNHITPRRRHKEDWKIHKWLNSLMLPLWLSSQRFHQLWWAPNVSISFYETFVGISCYSYFKLKKIAPLAAHIQSVLLFADIGGKQMVQFGYAKLRQTLL